jgi:hypothetical protein
MPAENRALGPPFFPENRHQRHAVASGARGEYNSRTAATAA